jgi:hypothetical protein
VKASRFRASQVKVLAATDVAGVAVDLDATEDVEPRRLRAEGATDEAVVAVDACRTLAAGDSDAALPDGAGRARSCVTTDAVVGLSVRVVACGSAGGASDLRAPAAGRAPDALVPGLRVVRADRNEATDGEGVIDGARAVALPLSREIPLSARDVLV